MSKECDSHEYKVGEYKGAKVLLHWEARSSVNEPKEFSTSFSYLDRRTENRVVLARIDNSHGKAHIHRFWQGQEKAEGLGWRGNDMELFGMAVGYLQDNWKGIIQSVL